jgi:hypothetical protein
MHFVIGFEAGVGDAVGGVTAGIGTGVDSDGAAGADCVTRAVSVGADPAVGLPQNGQKFSPSGTSLPHPMHNLVF